MSLPSIKVSLPLILIAWGVGAWAAGMWPLLIYPAMWAAVAAFLAIVSLVMGKPAPAQPAATESPASADEA